MAPCSAMICQQVTLSGDAEWPKVADAVIEALWGTCHSPGAESHEPGCHTASRRKTPVGHRPASLRHQGPHPVRRERSPDAPQSRYRARCDWGRGVHRWQPLAPCEHPPDSSAGREVTGNMLDYTAHMSSIQ